MSFIILLENGIIILFCLLIGCGNTSNNSQGKQTLKIIYISIPYKKSDKNSSYPYGYTTITSAKGYYPRIDHNFNIGGSANAILTLELTPIGELENSSFVEVFHESSDVEIAEFLNYYNLSDKN
jgi:hypothetical protein